MTSHRRRPLIRWHGGKWKIAKWIISHFPRHQCYVEPYGGGASVLLQKHPAASELYNDLDDGLIQLFRVLQDPEQAARLIQLLEITPFSMREFERAYQPAGGDPVETARRTLARSFMGVGTSGTSGRSTGFRRTVSEGKYPAKEWSTFPPALQLTVERLRDVVIESCDAMDLMRDIDEPETLFYLDPPYIPSTRGKKARRKGLLYHSYHHELTVEQHLALLEQLKTMRGMILLSGYPHALYDDNLPGWQRVERVAHAHSGLPRVECLWINPAAQEKLAAQRAESNQPVML